MTVISDFTMMKHTGLPLTICGRLFQSHSGGWYNIACIKCNWDLRRLFCLLSYKPVFFLDPLSSSPVSYETSPYCNVKPAPWRWLSEWKRRYATLPWMYIGLGISVPQMVASRWLLGFGPENRNPLTVDARNWGTSLIARCRCGTISFLQNLDKNTHCTA